MAAARALGRSSRLCKLFDGSVLKDPVGSCLTRRHLSVAVQTVVPMSVVALKTVFQKRCMASHHSYPYPDIRTEDAAKKLVVHLDDRGRSLLMGELTKLERKHAAANAKLATVSGTVLWEVFMFNGLPFIGFGILDNLIMIVAGEYIDATLGAALGISTMAAAALGNLVSDVAGVGTAGYVEMLVSKVGVHPPEVTHAQSCMWQTRWATGLGRAVGVSLGCLIGMFPLLLYKHDESEDKSCDCDHEEKAKQSPSPEGSSAQKSNQNVAAAS